MTPTEESATLLLQAAAKVEAALALLDLAHDRCPDCGRPVFRNHTHAKVNERLELTPEKLRVAASRIANDDDPRPDFHVCRA